MYFNLQKLRFHRSLVLTERPRSPPEVWAELTRSLGQTESGFLGWVAAAQLKDRASLLGFILWAQRALGWGCK